MHQIRNQYWPQLNPQLQRISWRWIRGQTPWSHGHLVQTTAPQSRHTEYSSKRARIHIFKNWLIVTAQILILCRVRAALFLWLSLRKSLSTCSKVITFTSKLAPSMTMVNLWHQPWVMELLYKLYLTHLSIWQINQVFQTHKILLFSG